MKKTLLLMLLASVVSSSVMAENKSKKVAEKTIEAYDQHMNIINCKPNPNWCAALPAHYADWKIYFQAKVKEELLKTKKYVSVNTLWDYGASYKDMTLRIFAEATPEYSELIKDKKEKAKAMAEPICFNDMEKYNVNIWMNIDLFDSKDRGSYIFKQSDRLGDCGYKSKAPILIEEDVRTSPVEVLK